MKARTRKPEVQRTGPGGGGGGGGLRPSRLARWAWAACVALIAYGSLTPWSGWRDAGVGAFSYLTAPWPRHVTWFDLTVNVLAYLPLGGLTVLALYPRRRGLPAVASATVLGLALSVAVEALQTFLPARVASNVDLLTNGTGALLGAVLAARFAPMLIDRGALAEAGGRWFAHDAHPALVLLALWPMAQIDPGPILFGNGRTEPLAPGPVGLPLAQPLAPPPGLGPAEFMLAEGIATACGMLAAALALASILRSGAPRHALLAALCVAALMSKALAYGVKFGAEYTFAWVTPGALSGLALGSVCLIAAADGRAAWLARASPILLCVSVAIVNLVPANPYHSSWIEQWQPGRLRHFSAAAAWLSTAWPYAMLAWQAYDLLMRRRAAARGA
jgi:VanZ family protein